MANQTGLNDKENLPSLMSKSRCRGRKKLTSKNMTRTYDPLFIKSQELFIAV